jgi:hypothetical protein
MFQQDIDYALQDMLAGGTDWQNSSLGTLLTEYYTQTMSNEEKEDWASKIGG